MLFEETGAGAGAEAGFWTGLDGGIEVCLGAGVEFCFALISNEPNMSSFFFGWLITGAVVGAGAAAEGAVYDVGA